MITRISVLSTIAIILILWPIVQTLLVMVIGLFWPVILAVIVIGVVLALARRQRNGGTPG